MNITFVEPQVFAVQGDIPAVAGESIPFACTFWDTATSPAVIAYVNRQLATSTIFPTNSPTASGKVVTLSLATGFTGGTRCEICVSATVGGGVRTRKINVIVGRIDAER